MPGLLMEKASREFPARPVTVLTTPGSFDSPSPGLRLAQDDNVIVAIEVFLTRSHF